MLAETSGMGYKDPDRQRQFQREWVAARRKAWLLENGPCAHCGSWNDLEVDHIDPTTKDPRFNALRQGVAVWSWSAERRERELAKCQVLCRTCHKAKTKAYCRSLARHGSRVMTFEEKCRCPLCQAYRDRWNARRRARRVARLRDAA